MSKTKEDKKTKGKAAEPEEKKQKNQLELFMDAHEDEHWNNLPEITYKISTGSLTLDDAMEGGYGPGIHRMGGASEGGKTSHTLKVAANFLETVPNSKVLYIKAEGRLSKKMARRSGMKFVANAADWEPGTCYVYKSNIYDSISELIHSLIINNPHGYKYMFIIDSVDAMIMKADMHKRMDGDDAVKVAGPNVMTKLLFKKCSLPCSELGHMIFVIAQVIANIKVGHTKEEQLNVGGTGGGNAQIHFADWILQFMPRFQKDLLINEGVSADQGTKVVYEYNNTNIVGHWCSVELKKSSNERTGQKVKYPIKYNADGDASIWTELEIKSQLENMQIIKSAGAWITFADIAMTMMEAEGLDVAQKINGNKKFLAVMADPKVLKFWKDYILAQFAKNEIL